MRLYHGTWEDGFIGICMNSTIYCNVEVSETTALLNEIIREYIGADLCLNCVYLSDNNKATEAYDYAFEVDIDNIDINLLYVADNRIKDEILQVYYSNDSDTDKRTKLSVLVELYNESFIPYSSYIEIKRVYDSEHYTEYLYFGDIPVEITEEDRQEVDRISC